MTVQYEKVGPSIGVALKSILIYLKRKIIVATT